MIQTNEMIFNNQTKQFRLNEEYVANELGTDLAQVIIDDFDTNSSTIEERVLKKTSAKLYQFLRANAISYKTACYLIATDEDCYSAFRDALIEQLYYYIFAGDVGVNSGINLETGVKTNKSFRDTISDNAIAILQSVNLFNRVCFGIPEEW